VTLLLCPYRCETIRLQHVRASPDGKRREQAPALHRKRSTASTIADHRAGGYDGVGRGAAEAGPAGW
jgi:hypothetical protein